MTVGVVGLGLIGGSVAKAYKADNNEKHKILALDKDKEMFDYSVTTGVTDAELTFENISGCDLIILCLYPEAAVQYLEKAAPYISKNAYVIDFCGTKRKICDVGFALAEKFGFTFVGGHPMAGTHNSGFKYSNKNMFLGAPMVVVPPENGDNNLLDRLKQLISPLGFSYVSVTTAQQHDEMIAFTSQMAHIVSNAYVKSPQAERHKGFSAGSYKDLTRVAWLNPDMWTGLFLENSDNLISELDIFIENVSKYKKALEEKDSEKLRNLLDEGRIIKGRIDG